MSRIEYLKSCGFFRTMKDEDLQRLSEASNEQDYEAGEIILQDGEEARYFYILKEGAVSLRFAESRGGYTQVISEKGELFGWSALLEETRQYTATAEVSKKAKVIVIEAEVLDRIMREDKEFGFDFMRQLAVLISKRLRSVRTQMLSMEAAEKITPSYG